MSTSFKKLIVCGGAKLQSGLLAFCIGISILSRSKHSVTRGLRLCRAGGKSDFYDVHFNTFWSLHAVKVKFTTKCHSQTTVIPKSEVTNC